MSNSQSSYPIASPLAGGQNSVVSVVVGSVDSSGNFIAANSTTGLPISGGGSGGGSSIADVLLTDNNGVLFVGRDSGATTGTIFTFYRLDTQAAYTPVGTIKATGTGATTIAANAVAAGAYVAGALVDGASVTQGSTTDAAAAAGAAGSDSAKLRAISRDIGTVAAGVATYSTTTLQTTGNTSLGSIDAKFPAKGVATSASSLPVVLASDDAQIGAKTTGSTLSAGGSGIIGWLSDSVTQLKLMVTSLSSLVTGTVLAAGTALIGKVGIDQTTPGTTNKVSIGTDGTVAINAALPAGTNLIGKFGIDQTTPGTTNAVSPQATENLIGKTVGVVSTPSTTVTRPANTTTYASGQLLANSVTAGSVTALQFTATRLAAGSATIRRGRLSKTSTTTTVSAFRLHLFSASPLAPTNGDGGVFIPVGAANYLGAIDFPSMIACTDGAAGNGAPLVGSDITFVLGSGTTIYGLIEVRAAYVPTSAEVFTVALEVFQN